MESRDILPEIRNTLPITVKLPDIYPLLFSMNQSLARPLIDCSSVFDSAPHELKSHIVTVFGVKPDTLEDYLKDRESDAA